MEGRNLARCLVSVLASPKVIHERGEQAERERQDDSEHHEEVQEDYSPSGAKGSEAKAGNGKKFQPKGRECPFL
jgi:hypothetical protein